MPLQIRSKLIKLDEADWSHDPKTLKKLKKVQEKDRWVVIDSIATDGYFNVTLPDGLEIVGLSGFHLEGFDDDGNELLGALRGEEAGVW